MSNDNVMKTATSIGSALAANRATRAISDLGADDVLGWVGLARRRSHFWENLALVSVGAVVGATGALLFAPSSGRETRRRMREKMGSLGDEATQKVDAAKNQLQQAKEHTAFSNAAVHAERNG